MKNSCLHELQFIGSKLLLNDSDVDRVVFCCDRISDWDQFHDQAVNNYLGPLILRTFLNESIQVHVPQTAFAKLSNMQNQVLARNIRLQQEFVAFGQLLNDEQIPLIPLKGIYLSEAIYKDPRLRHLSDIDVLIHEEHLDRVCRLMETRGWEVREAQKHSELEKTKFASAHPFTLVKNGIHIELHTHLYNRGQGATIDRGELWDHAEEMEFLGIRIMQFEPEMLLQHLCLHLHKHVLGYEVKMLGFCDIREFIHLHKDDLDWGHFKTLCIKYTCLNEVSQILYLCHKYWSVNVPIELRTPEIAVSELEEKFWSFFEGHGKKTPVMLQNRLSLIIGYFRKMGTPSEKFAFVHGFIFPQPHFIRQHYKLSPKAWLFPWYLFRPIELAGKMGAALVGKVLKRRSRKGR